MRRPATILLAALAAVPCAAQRLTVVIDAARGGSEYGARIDEHTYEKQVTLDLAERLRSLLQARDFDVVLTRDADTEVTNEQRAAVANRSKPVACLLLHATGSGTGLHLWTSSLNAMPIGSTAVLWDEAQSPFVTRSERLGSELAAAFARAKIPVSSGHTWIRPLDNMQCPAIAVEVAPRDSDTAGSDRSYQTHIADSIANQMLFWRGHADVVQSILNPPPPPAPPVAAPRPAAPGNGAATGTTGGNTPAGAPQNPATGEPPVVTRTGETRLPADRTAAPRRTAPATPPATRPAAPPTAPSTAAPRTAPAGVAAPTAPAAVRPAPRPRPVAPLAPAEPAA